VINLELTEEEAYDLAMYLGLHSTKSEHDTFPVFQKLMDILDPEKDDFRFSANTFVGLTHKTELTDTGLFMIGD
jgi:hypothetical protein